MHAGPGKDRRIAMMNQKGGVGKTTTAVNLGAALSEQGAEVMMIDLDPQAHLTLHTGLNPDELEHTVYGLLTEEDLTAIEVLQQVDTRLAVIPSEVDLAACETELANHPERHRLLKRKVDELASHFDYVLIDCPPSLGLLTLNALGVAGEVIVPMQAHFLALQGLSKLLETVQLVRGNINPALHIGGVVLCMHDKQTTLAQEVLADLQQFFDGARDQQTPWSDAQVFMPPVRRNIKLAECPSFGQTIFQYAPWCPGARDYRALAEALMRADGFDGAPPSKPHADH